MKQSESLRGRQVIRAIRMDGRVFEGELLKFFYVYKYGIIKPVRVAVIVSKGRGTAAHRNLIKRRIREACRMIVASTRPEPENAPFTLSFVAVYRGSHRPQTQRVSFASIKNDVAGFIASIRSSPANK